MRLSFGLLGVSDFRWPRGTRILSAEGRLDFNNAIWVYGSGDDDPGESGERSEARGTPRPPRSSRLSPRGGKPSLVIVGI